MTRLSIAASVHPPRLQLVLRLPIAAVCATATASACAGAADHGRPPNHHGSGLCRNCRSRPSAQPARLRPVPLLLIRADYPTTTTSACDATAHSGRPCHHDFGLCLCRSSWPPVRPPGLRPVLLLPVAAVCATTTASACAVTAHYGRQCNHGDFGLCQKRPSRPSVQPPRLRLAC